MKNIYTFKSYINLINEGLITTYNINKTISDIKKLFDDNYEIKKNEQ